MNPFCHDNIMGYNGIKFVFKVGTFKFMYIDLYFVLM